MTVPDWLGWAQRLQAIAQTGLSYEPPIFDRERYDKIQEIAAEMLAAHSGEPQRLFADLYSAQAGHATPKVDVRGVVFRGDALLLVRENLDGGRWTIPGGWADIGDTPAESAVREVYEETGYRTRAVKVLAVLDRSRHAHPPHVFHIYKIFFLCELLNGGQREAGYAAQTSAAFVETGEAAFFTEDAIPAELSLGRVTPAQIARFFEHHRSPALPTDFD